MTLAATAGPVTRSAAGTLTFAPEGHGSAIGHHGELLQGTFSDRFGNWHRALVTLPVPGMVTRAVFRPGPGGVVRVSPPGKRKARRAVELLLAEWAPEVGGTLTITGSGARPRVGMGSSTSDVTAALRAVADCLRIPVTDHDIATLAVRAEGASDSVMLPGSVVLFEHHTGHVLEEFKGVLPAMLVAGCDTDPERDGVDTLSFPPPRHTPAERAGFRVLLGGMRRAIATNSVSLLARVAEASAMVNQHYLPTRGFRALRQVARASGGLGVQVSHSGTVAGIIYDAAPPDAMHRAETGQRLMRRRGFSEPWIITVAMHGGFQ
jgi:uncharacterized protein involved in propanediol utilization